MSKSIWELIDDKGRRLKVTDMIAPKPEWPDDFAFNLDPETPPRRGHFAGMDFEANSEKEINAGIFRIDLSPLPGIRVVESREAVRVEEDWSKVRSPARARRRLKQGHKQRILRTEFPAAYQIGDMMICHPEIIKKLNEHARAQLDRHIEERWLDWTRGL